MAKVFLNSCLANQTFINIAEVEGKAVGVIMAKDIANHKCKLSTRIAWLISVINLLICKEGRKVAKIFDCVKDVDKNLVSSCQNKYQGELAFFAINEEYRGIGLGRKLFQSACEYMNSQNISKFYLFTDTSCNYMFYEHLGMKQCGQKNQTIHVDGQEGNMTFFIYEYELFKN